MENGASLGHIPEFEELQDRLRVDAAAESRRSQGRDGGREGDLAKALAKHQRLDAQPVARERQHAPRIIPHGESEHAAKAADQSVDSPLPVAVQEYLGIAIRPEPIAATLEFAAQFQEIVNATVEDNADLAVVGEHRLTPRLAQIQNRQAAVAQAGAVPVLQAFRIGAAPRQCPNHSSDSRLRCPGAQRCRIPRDSTHSHIISENEAWSPPRRLTFVLCLLYTRA